MKLNQIASLLTLRILAAAALTALFCSCAATTVKSTSKTPDFQGGRINKLAALAIDERPLLRQGFENRFVNQLRKGGATAVTTFNLLPLDEISHDKPAAAERFRAAGAEALVTIRLVDAATYYREFRSGPERYAETITGFEPGMWYGMWDNYYSVAFMDMSATYGSSKQQIYLETIVFDLKTAKRLWSALTETVFTDNMDRVAEMDPLVEKVVASMRKDGVVP
jgi:hypothetical protein